MLPMLALRLFTALLPASTVVANTDPLTTNPPQQQITTHTVYVSHDDAQADVHVISQPGENVLIADADNQDAVWVSAGAPIKEVVRVDQSQHTGPWIGVRLAPVPDPLAAHIGDAGLMVLNVVADSPADIAGIQRYDVILGFDGAPVDTLQDLIDAINQVGPDQATEIAIVSGAREHVLPITPTERPETYDYKYNEPDLPVIDNSFNMRGLKLFQNDDGVWTLQELGNLKNLPHELEVLKEFNVNNPDFSDKNFHWLSPDNLDQDLDLNFDFDLNTLKKHSHGDHEQTEITLEVKTDDQNAIIIARNPDGTIEVTRQNPDDTTTNLYQDAREFEASDPEAFEIYQHSVRHPQPPKFKFLEKFGVTPDLHDEFQHEVIVRLREIEQRMSDAKDRAANAVNSARQRADQALKEIEVQIQSLPGDQPGTTKTRMIQVEIEDDGTIVVTQGAGDQRRILEFADQHEFQQTEPELYDKVKGLLE